MNGAGLLIAGALVFAAGFVIGDLLGPRFRLEYTRFQDSLFYAAMEECKQGLVDAVLWTALSIFCIGIAMVCGLHKIWRKCRAIRKTQRAIPALGAEGLARILRKV